MSTQFAAKPMTPLAPLGEGPPLVEAANLSKRFGSNQALADVSLTIRPGSFRALLGENGAGKSTLVKCIMGTYQADTGSVRVGKHQVEITTPRQAHALGLGMVYQHFTLVENMTVVENLVLAPEGAGRHPLEERGRRPTRLHGADALQDRPGGDGPQPGGRREAEGRVAEAAYLRREVLILDEPTSVLTPDEADEVLGMVRAMCLRGELSALIITHKFREVQAFCDEVTVLRHGRLTGEGRVCDLTPAAMGEMMMGTAVIPAPSARIGDLSGGNVQRAVLARELGEDVEVLVVANPWFGLDFKAVAEIRSRIMQARNRGAAVLLVSEDLDEILELADRVLVISAGKIVHEEPVQGAERHVIGRYMAGH